jgi:hypothetical protein
MGSGWSWAVQAITADLALVTIVLLWVRQYRIARFTCAAQAAAVVLAWGVTMDRHFILPDLSVASAVRHLPVLHAFALVYAGARCCCCRRSGTCSRCSRAGPASPATDSTPQATRRA